MTPFLKGAFHTVFILSGGENDSPKKHKNLQKI